MAKQDWRYFLFLLAAHHPKEKLDHTIRLQIAKKEIHLCTRCTGIAFGMTTAIAIFLLGCLPPGWVYLPFIAVLPLSAIIDWFTQSSKKRKSTTTIRLATGYFLGIAEGLGFELLFLGFYLQFLVAVGTALTYALGVYLIAYKTKCLDAYVNEINQM
jgi:uncharacterized membrane protein